MKLILTIVLAFIVISLNAQLESAYVKATGNGLPSTYLGDYQCLGVNPGSLGMKKDSARIHIGLADFGVSAFTNIIDKKTLKEFVLYPSDYELTPDKRVDLAKRFANGNLGLNADFGIFSFGIRGGRLGNFAFSSTVHVASDIQLNETIADVFFNGYNSSYFDSLVVSASGDTTGISTNPLNIGDITDGTHINLTSYTSLSFGYGRQLMRNDKFSLFGGIDVKYIFGIAMLDIRSEDDKFKAYAATSSFEDFSSPNSSENNGLSNIPSFNGTGMGFDIGLSAKIGKRLTLGFAVNDIGSISWDVNVYNIRDDVLDDIDNPGIGSPNFEAIFADTSNTSNIFEWEGMEKQTVSLPTNTRIGASFSLTEKLLVGFDTYFPMNDLSSNFEKPIYSIGGTYKLLPILDISASTITGGNYDLNVPASINLNLKVWEFGIGTRDILTLFSNNSTKSFTPSLVVGLFRFKF